MNVYYIREFWFDDFYNGSGNVQRAFITWTGFNQQKDKNDGAIERLWAPARILTRTTRLLGVLPHDHTLDQSPFGGNPQLTYSQAYPQKD